MPDEEVTRVVRRPSQRGGTREAILAAATSLFAESGFHGTSLRDVAASAGLTHPGVLYHFPTKEALLVAVLARRDELMGLDHPTSAVGGREVLISLVDTAKTNAGRRGMVELFATLSAEATTAEHPAHDFFSVRYEALAEQIVVAYEDIASAGGLVDGVDPVVAAHQAIAMMDGLQVQWLYDSRLDMASALAAHFNAHLRVPLPR